jgi:hypothetical protein
MRVQMSVWHSDLISFVYIPYREIDGSFSRSIYIFWETFILIFIMAVLIYKWMWLLNIIYERYQHLEDLYNSVN